MSHTGWPANPNKWPIVTNFYRYRTPYHKTICTAYRYQETRADYRLVETISDTYCCVCHTSMYGGFGVSYYTRDNGDNNTILLVLCVGCVTVKMDDNGLLTWYGTMFHPGDPLDAIDPHSPDLLTILNEYYNALWLMKLIPSEKYHQLLRFAKKL